MYRDSRHPDLTRRSILRIHGYTLHRIQCPAIFCTINHLPDDRVLSVQMRLLCVGDEELRLVRVRSGVGTCDDATSIELEL